jgi:hypothetical protein
MPAIVISAVPYASRPEGYRKRLRACWRRARHWPFAVRWGVVRALVSRAPRDVARAAFVLLQQHRKERPGRIDAALLAAAHSAVRQGDAALLRWVVVRDPLRWATIPGLTRANAHAPPHVERALRWALWRRAPAHAPDAARTLCHLAIRHDSPALLMRLWATDGKCAPKDLLRLRRGGDRLRDFVDRWAPGVRRGLAHAKTVVNDNAELEFIATHGDLEAAVHVFTRIIDSSFNYGMLHPVAEIAAARLPPAAVEAAIARARVSRVLRLEELEARFLQKLSLAH